MRDVKVLQVFYNLIHLDDLFRFKVLNQLKVGFFYRSFIEVISHFQNNNFYTKRMKINYTMTLYKYCIIYILIKIYTKNENNDHNISKFSSSNSSKGSIYSIDFLLSSVAECI